MEIKKEPVFCRLCLTTVVVYNSLLKDNGLEMLKSLTGVELAADNSYSTDSCVKCWVDLKSAYSIQQKFLESEKKLQTDGVECVESKFNVLPEESSACPEEDVPDIVTDLQTYIKEEQSDDCSGEKGETSTTPLLLRSVSVILLSSSEADASNQSNMSEDEEGFDELIYIRTDEDDHAENGPEVHNTCFICGIRCENSAALYSHTNSHYNQEQCCDTCLIKLPNITMYRKHIESTHVALADKTYSCGICSLSFRYLPLYELHLVAVHPRTARSNKKKSIPVTESWPTELKFTCEECNKVFRSKHSLNSHIKGHIKKPCPTCGALITLYNLSKHIKNHNESPVVCHVCGMTAKNPESLRGHMYYTHSQKSLKCETCGRIFKKLYAYKLHIQKEHIGERKFICDACGKRFFTNYELNNHIKLRHLKERKHICQYCKKGFASRFSMRTHERQHTNEAPYVCEVCGEGFRQNVSLRAHRKSKHNIIESSQAVCGVCGKGFKDDWALKSHTRSVHD